MADLINFLFENPSRQRLVDAFNAHSAQLVPRMDDPRWARCFRKPLVARMMEFLRPQAAADMATILPPLTAEMYADYGRTGKRLPFETPYFQRRARLMRAAACVLAYPDEPPWRGYLLKIWRDVFFEVSWALPAHVPAGSPRPGIDPLLIDLFTAETANLMAEMAQIFSPIAEPDFLADIQRRLHADVFENYLQRDPPFSWTKMNFNWNAVCHQGVLGSALAMEPDVHLLADLWFAAQEPLRLFLSGFTADGGCSEGPGYWAYGFGLFCLLNEQFETRTGGVFSLLENTPNIQAIASYGPLMSLMGPRLVNFSDCTPDRHALSPALLTYLASRLHHDACGQQAESNFHFMVEHPHEAEGHRNELLRQFLKAPEDIPREAQPTLRSAHFPDLGIAVSRHADAHGHTWEFAAKAGHNAEHHNHNDCGSFLLHIDGTPLLAEIGAPEYVQAFFGPERYTFFAARSLGHSVPVVNGYEQLAGRRFSAQILNYQETADGCALTLDLAGAYPAEAGIRSLQRTLIFRPMTEGLTIQESWDVGPFNRLEFALITHVRVSMNGTKTTLVRDNLTLEITAAGAGVPARVEEHAYSNHTGESVVAQRIVFAATRPAGQMTLSCQLR